MRAKNTEFIEPFLAPARALREQVNIPVQDPIYIGPVSNPFKGYFVVALSALSININEWVLIILVCFIGDGGLYKIPNMG